MSDFDDRLRANLSEDDKAFLRDLEDGQGLFNQMTHLFRGPMAAWTWVANTFVVAATGAGLYFAYKFIVADDTQAMLLWAGAAWAAWTMQIALKQWMWDRINHLGVLRELKKIELRLMQLERGEKA
ncbi:MAG: DUF6768 family protein [Pseudomonadota bacterium]